MTGRWRAARTAGAVATLAGLAVASGWPAAAGVTGASITGSAGAAGTAAGSAITDISHACSGQNAEVEQALDPASGYVYEEWMGCHNHIAFARSADGGRHFSKPVVLSDSAGAWDPALAVGPGGKVYAAFMNGTKHHTFPVIEASVNHGQSFPQVRRLVSRKRDNWGDRDFIAVSRTGTVYLTWDYGPSAKAVKYICNPVGSCAFAAGDLNVVLQKSTDGGRTWSRIIHISPGFPASGGDSAPLVIEPDGRIDVMYQGYRVTNRKSYALAPAHSYFTASANGGRTWTRPVRIGPPRLTMSLAEWWIDGALSRDAAGNLYATFDTQGHHRDIGWLSYSTDHGRTWSRLLRVTPDRGSAVHIVEVAGGAPGQAYVAWLADSSPRGYAEYLRPFSVVAGWLSGPVQVSRQFGDPKVWPGDTFGISAAAPGWAGLPGLGRLRLVLSWGSAIGRVRAGHKPVSEIFATALRPGWPARS